jgi:hypothetical protein
MLDNPLAGTPRTSSHRPMATKFPYQTSSDALTKPAKNTTFFQGWVPDVDNQNHDLLCAEMSRLAYASPSEIAAPLAGIGFSEVAPFDNQTTGTQGFAANNPSQGLTVLAFRGTQPDDFPDLISDAEALQGEHPGGGRVHHGFKKAYQSVDGLIPDCLGNRQSALLVTGHSLGAALATLAALDVAPTKLITFGSPRVGDAKFCARLAGMTVHRFVDCCDVITRVAPERFDRENFLKLFRELGNFAGLAFIPRKAATVAAEAVAAALAGAFSSVEKQNRFAHVAPARYIQTNGILSGTSDPAQQLADQQSARSGYHHATEAHFFKIVDLIKSLPIAAGPRPVVRELIRGLFDLIHDAPVPLRDLADHAPLNYVSAFTGRT